MDPKQTNYTSDIRYIRNRDGSSDGDGNVDCSGDDDGGDGKEDDEDDDHDGGDGDGEEDNEEDNDDSKASDYDGGDGDDGEESDPFQTRQRRSRELTGTILFRHSNVDLESLLAHSWLCSIAGLI